MWVLLLATLFGGIVALNVGALRSSIAASRIDGEAAALRSQNADIESNIASRSGYGRISELARQEGMVQVQPSRRNYLRLHPGARKSVVNRPARTTPATTGARGTTSAKRP
jgi:hypothetical protein